MWNKVSKSRISNRKSKCGKDMQHAKDSNLPYPGAVCALVEDMETGKLGLTRSTELAEEAGQGHVIW